MHYVLKKFSSHPLKNGFAPHQNNKKKCILVVQVGPLEISKYRNLPN